MDAPCRASRLGPGTRVGAVNGFLSNRRRIHPLILTFGMLSVLQGAIFVYTNRSVGQAPPQLVLLATGGVFRLPSALLLLALLALAGHLLLHHSPVVFPEAATTGHSLGDRLR